jgi:CRISPR system Cascade subunit CasA
MDKEFNLLREAWIRVLDDGGALRQVSLLEALGQARHIARLAGELPSQDVALLRLLLAALYSAYASTIARLRDEDEAVAFWKSLWERGGIDLALVEAYLAKYEERFWLFHPQTPFYQIANLSKGSEYSAAKLMGDLSESGNKPRLFAGRSGDGKLSLEYPEAARWLLYLNAFDDNSAKPTRGGEKKPSVGAGYLGRLGLVYADGDNLFETLMLNFITQSTDGDDKPIWEVEPRAIERCVLAARPNTYARLFTLQSRRLLLKREAAKVTGFILLGGDKFEIENAFIEYMTIWQKTKNAYKPKRHNPAKSFWRDFAALTAKNDSARQPGIVSWMAALRENQLLPRTHISFRIAGVKYGDSDYFVDEVFSDSVTINAAILAGIGKHWITRICDALDTTEKYIQALRDFAKALELAAGNSSNPKSSVDAASVHAYFDLDPRFRKWLRNIDPGRDDKDDKVAEWLKIVRRHLFAQAEEMLKNAGVGVLTGPHSVIPQHSKFRNIIRDRTIKPAQPLKREEIKREPGERYLQADAGAVVLA